MKPAHAVYDQELRFGGKICVAKTDLGHDVAVWMPPGRDLPVQPLQDRHHPLVQRAHELMHGRGMIGPFRGLLFCHGHALGTFEKYGYSVYGGDGMELVLSDEYIRLAPRTLTGARAGDIIVWRRSGTIVHSAKLEIVLRNNPTSETTKISSKDTYSGFSHDWLTHYLREWGDDWRIYRHR